MGVVIVVGAVIVLKSAKVALVQCSVTLPAIRVVSDCALSSKAPVTEEYAVEGVAPTEVVGAVLIGRIGPGVELKVPVADAGGKV